MVAMGGFPGGLPPTRRDVEQALDPRQGERQTQVWMNELRFDPDAGRDVDELEEHPDDYATFGDPDVAYDDWRDARDA